MPILVLDPELESELREGRLESGVDRFDEVWDGTYIIGPVRGDEHQRLVGGFSTVFSVALDPSAQVRAGICISDRASGWKRNYRFPDVAVHLNESRCKNLGTHWRGGPDFLVEIVTPGDRTREKLDFYSAIRTREVLVVDRDPWGLELYRFRDGRLVPVGVSDIASPVVLTSEVLPLTFRLVEAEPTPKIEVTNRETGFSW